MHIKNALSDSGVLAAGYDRIRQSCAEHPGQKHPRLLSDKRLPGRRQHGKTMTARFCHWDKQLIGTVVFEGR